MRRPNPDCQEQIRGIMRIHYVDEATAVAMLRFGRTVYDRAVEQGQAEAQRFYRITLGLEPVSASEAAELQLPVPVNIEVV